MWTLGGQSALNKTGQEPQLKWGKMIPPSQLGYFAVICFVRPESGHKLVPMACQYHVTFCTTQNSYLFHTSEDKQQALLFNLMQVKHSASLFSEHMKLTYTEPSKSVLSVQTGSSSLGSPLSICGLSQHLLPDSDSDN